ncbi:MAG TPA: hypothetical protein VEA61_06425 [Allosphingosinicella sp.]|nr:hypothetical protein [Allosphingosinicella sp.]
MQHVLVVAEILVACLIIAGFAAGLVMFSPAARRRRRRRRHSAHQRIDLFVPSETEARRDRDV